MSLFGCANDEQFINELNIVSVNQYQHDNPTSRNDKTFMEQIEEEFRDSKCDYCNCALRDCSLCGSNVEG